MKNGVATVSILVLGGVPAVAQEAGLPTARDASQSATVPTPRDTIPLERLKTLAARNAGAEFDPNRVITPHMPIGIRQEHPGGQHRDAGALHQDVQAVEYGDSLLDRGMPSAAISDVMLDEQCIVAELRGDGLSVGGIDIGDQDFGAFGGDFYMYVGHFSTDFTMYFWPFRRLRR